MFRTAVVTCIILKYVLSLKIKYMLSFRNFITVENGNRNTGHCNKVLIIQCDFDEASHSANLIASAK